MNKNIPPPSDSWLASTLSLLEGNEVRTISVDYQGIIFQLTYNPVKLTRFAYYNRVCANPTLYMVGYMEASVTEWTLLERDGVTPVAITQVSLLALAVGLITAIGKEIAADYTRLVNVLCQKQAKLREGLM